MGKLLVILLALLAPLPAYAGAFQDQNGKWWDIPTPPLRFFTMTYKGRLDVRPASAAEILDICTAATGKTEHHGCAFVYPDWCLIHVSEDLPILFRNAVLQHERAHCNGWSADHPPGAESLSDEELLRKLNGPD